MLLPNERVLTIPPDIPLWDLAEFPRVDVYPGRYLALYDPPPGYVEMDLGNGQTVPFLLRSHGDRIATGGSAEEASADGVTVLSLGPIPESPHHPAYEAALDMHRFIAPSDHLLITPYCNRFWKIVPGKMAHVGGLDGDDWLDTTIAKRVPGCWSLLGNWVAVLLHSRPRPVAYTRRKARSGHTWTRTYEDWGTVMACGPDAKMAEPGQNVVVLGKSGWAHYDCKFFVPSRRVGDKHAFPVGTVFFRESSMKVRRNQTLELEVRIGGSIEAAYAR